MLKRFERRTILTCVLAAGLAGIGASVATTRAADGPVSIKLATLLPRGTSYHQILLAMREKWRQAPGGGVALTIYTDGTMGGETAMVSRIRVGQIQAGVLTVKGLSEIDDSVTALQNMPMMFRSMDEVDYIREKLRPGLEKRLLEKGFVVLFWGDAGWVRFFSREPILRPADLKRTKVFVWAGDNHQIDLMKAAGYQPVPLETNDILTGLQTGLINAIPTIPFFALAGQLYGSTPHMLELNWAPLVGATVIASKTWDSIPPATQTALLQAAAEAGEQFKVKSRSENEQAVTTMKKRGLQVHPVTPEIEAEWRRSAEEIYPKIRGTMVPAAMFDEVRRLLQEYRTSGGGAKQ